MIRRSVAQSALLVLAKLLLVAEALAQGRFVKDPRIHAHSVAARIGLPTSRRGFN
jgi:hypothetical protein